MISKQHLFKEMQDVKKLNLHYGSEQCSKPLTRTTWWAQTISFFFTLSVVNQSRVVLFLYFIRFNHVKHTEPLLLIVTILSVCQTTAWLGVTFESHREVMQLFFFSVVVCCLAPTKCSTVEVSCFVVPEQRQPSPYSMVEKSGFLFCLRVASGAKICVECYSNQCVLKTSSFFFLSGYFFSAVS